MDQDLPSELEAFVRWLALAPNQLADYTRDPEAFFTTVTLSTDALAALRAVGVEAVRREVLATAEEIFEAPESWRPSSFTRDTTVGGYGRRPAAGEEAAPGPVSAAGSPPGRAAP